jgi:DNA-directed RNA polymerase specialized sigma subunit
MNKATKRGLLSERVRQNTIPSDFKDPNSQKEMRSFIFEELGRMRDSRVREVYSLRYFSGGKMTWAKIGERLGFSSQTAINLHKKGAELLKRKIVRK